MMRFFHLTAPAALLLVTSATSAQETVQWRVTPEDVQLACHALRRDMAPGEGQGTSESPDPTQLNRLKRFCNLSLGGWDAWAQVQAGPTGNEIVEWANRARKHAEETALSLERTGTQTVPVIVSPSIIQPGQAGAATTQRSLLTESTIILGLADFLVERTEAEIQSWVLPRFYSALCGDSVATKAADLKLPQIFPETCHVLEGGAPLGLQNAVRAVRAAIVADFNHLPKVVLSKLALGNHPEVGRVAELAYDLLSDVSRDPESMVRAFANLLPDAIPSDQSTEELYRIALLMKAVLATSESNHLPDSDSEWLETLKAVVVNGLQDFGTAPTDLGLRRNTALATAALPVSLPRLTAVRDRLVAAHEALVQLRQAGPASVSDSAGNGEAHRQRIAAILTNVTEAFTIALGEPKTPSDSTLHSAIAATSRAVIAVKTQNFAAAIGAFTTLVRELKVDALLPPSAVRLVAFAADVSQSTTPDDVKRALHSLASAAASRGDKRTRDHGWLVALQAYGGLSSGSEWVNSDAAWFGGLYAPVGFEVTPCKSLVGLFVQIIDVGAIASARLAGSDEVDPSPEVGFRQVVAPGAFLTVAVRNSPVSFGFGASRAAGLRSLETGQERDAWRVGAFVGIDIPIFP